MATTVDSERGEAMSPLVVVDGLTIRYGNVTAVNDVSFTVASGQVVGLIGGNGAGKSSTLRAIAGVNAPSQGRVSIRGRDLSKAKAAADAHRVTGYCPDVGGLIPRATIRDHIALSLAFRGASDLWEPALELVEKFGLTYALDRTTAGFSHGESRRLSVLLAGIASREVLILDEPFDGVDPLGVDATLSLVQDAAAAGVAVIVSTHLLALMTECAHDVVVMAAGNAVDRGPVDLFRGDEGVARYTELLRGALR